MKILFKLLLALPILALLAATASAQDAHLTFGGDQYAAGQQVSLSAPVEGDTFIAGFDVGLNAPATGSAHLTGFNVSSNAEVGGNLYSAGFTVNINAPVAGSVSAAGNTVGIANAAQISGNARLAGASVSLAAPVSGSVLVSAETLTLAGTISGDFSFFGRTITFAPGAKIDGSVQIHAPEEIEVPASVAAPGQISYSVLEDTSYMDHAGRTVETVARGFWPILGGFVAFWLVLAISGATLMALAPKRVERMQALAETGPARDSTPEGELVTEIYMPLPDA